VHDLQIENEDWVSGKFGNRMAVVNNIWIGRHIGGRDTGTVADLIGECRQTILVSVDIVYQGEIECP